MTKRSVVGALLFILAGAACDDSDIASTGSGSTGVGASSGSMSSGSTSSGSQGGGGSAPVAREIDVTLKVSPAAADPDQVLVLLNHVDGTLAKSWLGGALPTKATVVDGDVVSFAYASDNLYPAYLDSYRIAPGVESVDGYADLVGFEPQNCELATTHFVVNVPAVVGGTTGRVMTAFGGIASVDQLPATVELDQTACVGAPLGVLVTVDGEPDKNYAAFEAFENIPQQPGGTVTLSATFANQPRKVLPLEISGIPAGSTAYLNAHWYGDRSVAPNYITDEHGFALVVVGPAAFPYAPNLMDLPSGGQLATADVQHPPSGDACRRTSNFARFGRSDAVIPFDATALGEPLRDGNSWKLGEGLRGDVVTLYFFYPKQLAWRLDERPDAPGFPAVFPAFPATLPAGFVVPTNAPLLDHISHRAFEDTGNPLQLGYTYTFSDRRTSYVCN